MEIPLDDFVLFIDRALDGMLEIAEELGDEKVNLKPDLPGANSPYAILFHCSGMLSYWIGNLLGGRDNTRDRPAEFVSKGNVADLRKIVASMKSMVREDLPRVSGDADLQTSPNSAYSPLGGEYGGWKQGTVLIHAYEELAQHHGQMELTRDIIVNLPNRVS